MPVCFSSVDKLDLQVVHLLNKLLTHGFTQLVGLTAGKVGK